MKTTNPQTETDEQGLEYKQGRCPDQKSEEPERSLTRRTSGTDMRVINLSNFLLAQRHTDPLQRGMSFSPTSHMDEFNVFKDVTPFLCKVFLRFLHTNRSTASEGIDTSNSRDKEILEILNSLLDENEETEEPIGPQKRQLKLNSRSKKNAIAK